MTIATEYVEILAVRFVCSQYILMHRYSQMAD